MTASTEVIFEQQPHITAAIPSSRHEMSAFHFISWVFCTVGVTFPFAVWSIVHPKAGDTVPMYILGFVLTVAYFSIPYWAYHKQVTGRSGWFSVLVFLASTGIFAGILLALLWDML